MNYDKSDQPVKLYQTDMANLRELVIDVPLDLALEGAEVLKVRIEEGDVYREDSDPNSPNRLWVYCEDAEYLPEHPGESFIVPRLYALTDFLLADNAPCLWLNLTDKEVEQLRNNEFELPARRYL